MTEGVIGRQFHDEGAGVSHIEHFQTFQDNCRFYPPQQDADRRPDRSHPGWNPPEQGRQQSVW